MTLTANNKKRAVLRVRPGQFVVTPAIEQVAIRALRYLTSGFAIHLRGPAGTGKTTLAMHLANCLDRPIMLIFGDDEFKSSDLIGSESGYTHKKLLDNYIHSVLKVEDEFKQNWVDSRLTLACREGFTLVYDEFNRSRPEVNNVLLSALEEKILTLPPSSNQPEYLHVNPQFRAIFTSNPEEYCGVHSTQDALMDRLVTINMPEPDELTQTEILAQKTALNRADALLVVQLVKAFRSRTGGEKTSGLRSCLMIAKVCAEHNILVAPESSDFREICADVLFNRTNWSASEATTIFLELLNHLNLEEIEEFKNSITSEDTDAIADEDHNAINESGFPTIIDSQFGTLDSEVLEQPGVEDSIPFEREIYLYLQQYKSAALALLQQEFELSRTVATNALNSLEQKGLVSKNNHVYTIEEPNQP
ncbi:ATPase associated with various cellular activities [Trichormus variabilis ATCC 29413]|uniref:ATPase associated with various cellular activities n=2 Tax=Anabaena variabilis TaxID=264691 RepID=Q3MH34_TRIV2|nr:MULTISPECIES: gas vesicle protein GvpN [Nostocaceae]ABA19702.1 ATPase associated with various cellular activities [Trichormus variabilis ATCC 29413]MBC1213300.1 gas vesicle protein GvpN [Trichormus variabilis ARAD]MBC1255867.1 gas vesicle protein GvpN [Trichormus variabilis V5]MBC1268285.1 gas vesicle protein GvpN [Trichormus variabilis FSR]MBC1302940.1 gas vesicle protein GvpN [Trichormus variabilis N2B]